MITLLDFNILDYPNALSLGCAVLTTVTIYYFKYNSINSLVNKLVNKENKLVNKENYLEKIVETDNNLVNQSVQTDNTLLEIGTQTTNNLVNEGIQTNSILTDVGTQSINTLVDTGVQTSQDLLEKLVVDTMLDNMTASSTLSGLGSDFLNRIKNNPNYAEYFNQQDNIINLWLQQLNQSAASSSIDAISPISQTSSTDTVLPILIRTGDFTSETILPLLILFKL